MNAFPLSRAILALLALTAACAAAADDSQSLFDERRYQSLVAERKARRAGDVLTVVVQESATATSSTGLQAQRNFSVGTNVELNRIGRREQRLYGVQAGTSSESDGTGTTQRSGRLLAQLSVRVLEITPDGDLVVSGQQSLKINGEEQLITLSGVVRPQDVAADNTVLSSRIGDARIRFDGQGFVTEQSRPGWLARLFAFLGV